MHEYQLFAAQIRRKKTWKNFVFFLSKITFEPDTPGTWKRGKRAKWIRWDVKRPGVAPKKVILKFVAENGRDNWQVLEMVLKKRIFFRKNLS